MIKITTILLFQLTFIVKAQYQTNTGDMDAEYYLNPIFAGDYPDPSSDPIDLKINNIDPGHVVDKNGKRYLYSANGGFVPLSDDGLTVIGETKHVYDGWPIPRDWTIECFCLEGPKITNRGDYYYLTVAEGGTAGPATGHMIISARSKSPFGPWENSPYNPIERTLDISEKWWSKGHGTLFDDTNGDWWIIFHGYENGHHNMGRQTLMQPVEWTADNSLVIKAKGNSVSDSSPLLYVPSDHSYIAEVELFIEGNATGGLVLFYNNGYYSGILADHENILANLRGWQFVTASKVFKRHVFLRLKNINNTVDMFYSIDGVKWN